MFFLAGALSVAAGMAWGVQMSISQDHILAPAPAHLDLAGWVTLALFGVYYYLTRQAASCRLARVNLAVVLLALVTFAPGIALAISGRGEALAMVRSLATFASIAIFLVTMLRHGLGEADPTMTQTQGRGVSPA